MKLRSKLLLGVGILLLGMAIIIYILPIFFIREDVHRAAEQVQSLLIEEHKALARSQQAWVKDEVQHMTQNINSMLLTLYEDPTFAHSLSLTDDKELETWKLMAEASAFDPEVGLIQIHDMSAKKSAVITPAVATFFHAAELASAKELTLFSLGEGEIYVGTPLPPSLQKERGYTYYALMLPSRVDMEQKEIHEEVERLVSQAPKSSPQSVLSSSYDWAIKINMIRNLTPLFVEGLLLEGGVKKNVPDGIARIDTSGRGAAILSDQVFRTTPVFNDSAFYQAHVPKTGAPPIPQAVELITLDDGKWGFIGNTLKLDSVYVTVATPLNHLVKQLALSSNTLIIVELDEGAWVGYDGSGKQLFSDELHSFLQAGFMEYSHGRVKVGNQSYLFTRLAGIEGTKATLYAFQKTGGHGSILGTLFKLEGDLSQRISLQLLLIAIGTMVLVLLFVWRIAFGVIAPITKLAQATSLVTDGHYDEVALPDVGKRKDEVATLTQSFGEMVKGLEERAKIRGVLDKVVSKDVADEILRSQIHLGGEDRDVSMLFSDIRNFTELTQNFLPQETIQLLNTCMTKISRVIEGEGGVIDKYVGDEVMAIYGAPTPHPQHALRAVSTGILVLETLKKWNEERVAEGKPLIEMGIGVHTGLVVVGNMGAEDRLNYTVIGTNVNLAARLCEVAKGGTLIISEATLHESGVRDSCYVKPLAPIALKGFTHPVSIYEVTGFRWV